jgi:hypothetical protein
MFYRITVANDLTDSWNVFKPKADDLSTFLLDKAPIRCDGTSLSCPTHGCPLQKDKTGFTCPECPDGNNRHNTCRRGKRVKGI